MKCTGMSINRFVTQRVRAVLCIFVWMWCFAFYAGARDSYQVYRVKPGDTLYSISRSSKVSVDEIMTFNHFSSAGELKAGMKIKIPADGKESKAVCVPQTKPVTGSVSRKDMQWPLQSIKSVQRDGEAGVKPIGIIIKGAFGSRVRAVSAGVIEKVGRMRGYGNFVVVRHKGDFVTVYSGLSIIMVKEGETVEIGGMLGVLDANESILHFMTHRAGKIIDPLSVLPKR